MIRTFRFRGVAACLLALALAFGGAGSTAAAELDDLVVQRMNVNDAAAQSQQRVDKLSTETDEAVAVYRSTLQRIDALRTYNGQLSLLITSQDAEMGVLRQEIDDVELVAREVTPLMLGMIDALENFVELDVPFLADEREKRLAGLHEIMLRADVTDAERYRRIVEAYQIENEYGRTIEAYQGELLLNGQSREVEFLRVGRVAFLYQTLDAAETGVWDHAKQSWTDAAESRSAVRKGIRIARKQAAPDLLRLPVPAAEAAK